MPDQPRLLVLPSAPVMHISDGRLRLDTKFVDGMDQFRRAWPGPVDCMLRESAEPIPFGRDYGASELGFPIELLPHEAPPPPELADRYDVILLAGDSHSDLDFAAAARGRRAKTAYAIEYTLGTRLRVALLDHSRSLPRRLWSCLWNLRQERRRRAAIRAADALQVNGYPALGAFGPLNPDTTLYLDNRMAPDLFATESEMADRAHHLRAGGPLRLINSGRLEPMKGAQDLLPVARALAAAGTDFTLDIFGTGSLAGEIAAGIAAAGLSERVRLHDPVDFATALVPLSRRQADVFLSCHRQSDPSCTYVEAMGCGLPVAGYANAMLAELARESAAGWTVPLGRPRALAARIAALAAEREEILRASAAALAFARAHDFETEFARRTDQLLRLAGAAAPA